MVESSSRAAPQSEELLLPEEELPEELPAEQSCAGEGVVTLSRSPAGDSQFTAAGRPLRVTLMEEGKTVPGEASSSRWRGV